MEWISLEWALFAVAVAVFIHFLQRANNPVTRWLGQAVEAVLDFGFGLMLVGAVFVWVVCYAS